MDKQEKIITIATVALLVLVVLVIVLVWGYYSNWFTTSFERIYLEANGQRLQQAEIYRLGNVKFNVKQFGFKRGFSVNVVVASDEDFIYSVDGIYYKSSEALLDKDLIGLFDVQLDEESFVLRAHNVCVSDLLKALYPKQEVQLISKPEQPILFKLTVTSNDGKHSFSLTFNCRLDIVDDIDVYPNHVYANARGELCATIG